MVDLDPAALTERVLRLGRVPPLNRLTTPELELLASAGRELVCTTRTVLVPADEPASAFYVALTGRLTAMRGGQVVPGDPVRDSYGASSILGNAVLSADVAAEAGTVLFVLDRDAFFGVLEEHGAFQRSLLRDLSKRVMELREGELVTSGTLRRQDSEPLPSNLLFRLRLFHDALGLESRSLPVLAQLVRAVRVRQTEPEGRVWDTAGGPASVVVVVEGALDVRRDGQLGKQLHPWQCVGLTEAVAAVPMAYEASAVGETVTLELSSGEIHEAIEDHDDFCMDLLRLTALELHRRTLGSSVAAHA
jgi:CRP-like cAMP-binding protein